MAFPRTPLPLRVYIAPGAEPGGDTSGWQWQEITSDVRVAEGVVIEGGRGDEATQVDPGKCTLTIDNRSGHYSPRNPLGQWFGELRRNTPLRVTVDTLVDAFGRTVAAGSWGTATTGGDWLHTAQGDTTVWSIVSGWARQSWSTLNIARVAVTDEAYGIDTDATVRTRASAVMTGAAMVTGILARYRDGSNYYALRTEFNSGGTITAKISKRVGGVTTTLAEVAPVPTFTYTAGTVYRSRAQVEGSSLRLKVWPDASPEPDDWTVTATDSSLLNAGWSGLWGWLLSGNTNTLPVYAEWDDFRVEAVQFLGTVPEWPPRWGDKAANSSHTPIVASGAFRRLQQGDAALQSPIFRNLSAITSCGYWPLEDEQGATLAGSVVTGAGPATVTAGTFADDSTLPGAKTTLGVATATRVSGRCKTTANVGSWGVVLYFKLTGTPAADTVLVEVDSTGTMRRWEVGVKNTGYFAKGYNSAGTLTVDHSFAFVSDIMPNRWVALHLRLSTTGGTTTIGLYAHGVGEELFWFLDDTYSGSAGVPTAWDIIGSTGFNDGNIGHLFFATGLVPFVTTAFRKSSNGHIGETAAERVARLCGEEGVPYVVEPGDSEPMGRQAVDTFLSLLRAAEAADMGVLYERGNGIGYRSRGARYNTSIEAVLDFAQGHVAEAPEPTDDDQRVRNDWTVSRPDGATVRYVDEAHVAAFGRYDDAVELNIEDDNRLTSHASWRVHLGTVDEMRWPRVELDLAARVALIPEWLAMRHGSRFTIANAPSQVKGDAIDLLVEGWAQTLGVYDWDVVLSCSPASPWLVGVVDTDRVQTDGASLVSAITTSATSFSVASVDALFTTTGGHFPFTIVVGGERMSVTNITGGSSPQTFTVTRSTNGIVKAHAAGTAVEVYRPIIVAL